MCRDVFPSPRRRRRSRRGFSQLGGGGGGARERVARRDQRRRRRVGGAAYIFLFILVARSRSRSCRRVRERVKRVLWRSKPAFVRSGVGRHAARRARRRRGRRRRERRRAGAPFFVRVRVSSLVALVGSVGPGSGNGSLHLRAHVRDGGLRARGGDVRGARGGARGGARALRARHRLKLRNRAETPPRRLLRLVREVGRVRVRATPSERGPREPRARRRERVVGRGEITVQSRAKVSRRRRRASHAVVVRVVRVVRVARRRERPRWRSLRASRVRQRREHVHGRLETRLALLLTSTHGTSTRFRVAVRPSGRERERGRTAWRRVFRVVAVACIFGERKMPPSRISRCAAVGSG